MIAKEQGAGRSPDRLNPPHGGELVDLIVSPERASALHAASRQWLSWELTEHQLYDLELLLNGAFSPLRGFMSRANYESTRARMRLSDGTIWPTPIVLEVPDNFARAVTTGSSIALRDPEGVMLAALHVEEVWRPEPHQGASFDGISSSSLEHSSNWCLGGPLEGIQLPLHYDFRVLRLTPADLRAEFMRLGWRRVIAFHTSGLMHRAQHELTLQAAKKLEANLLIHPSVGTAKRENEHYTRIRCYEALLPKYPKDTVKLCLLPLAARQNGPREAFLRAIVHKNYGCSHVLLGPEHAALEGDEADNRHELLEAHQNEIGIVMAPFREMVYLKDRVEYVSADEVPIGAPILSISESELRSRLSTGREIPSWYTFPEVAQELQRSCPPRQRQGFTVFFTGLSGAGKSTIANVLLVKFLEMGGRPVTLLDGDIVRKHLSSELGFSREHRDLNIRRIGFVASEITKNGGIAICAPIAPFDSVRRQVREMIEPHGGFILVHLSTSLDVCEKRDRKGLYAKARAGIVKQFTGISDPYEIPRDADVTLDTDELTPEEAAHQIFLHLEREGFIGVNE